MKRARGEEEEEDGKKKKKEEEGGFEEVAVSDSESDLVRAYPLCTPSAIACVVLRTGYAPSTAGTEKMLCAERLYA